MVYSDEILVMSKKPVEMINITEAMREALAKSNLVNGIVCVITAHTTTGITVNEGLECLEYDILALLKKLVPDNDPYRHAHFLPDYGRTSANATGHLKGMLTGNSCIFAVKDGRLRLGEAQQVYLVEFDGPQERKVSIVAIGE